MSNTENPSPLIVTDAAAAKLHEIILEENNPQLKLRISITGGGCSGFQYAFDLDENQQETDIAITKTLSNTEANNTTVYILVDPMSLMYLTGAEIDFKKTTAGEEFVIRNPHAKTTCGCGSSFGI
jgi:iron-sulfur cluster insertion protein